MRGGRWWKRDVSKYESLQEVEHPMKSCRLDVCSLARERVLGSNDLVLNLRVYLGLIGRDDSNAGPRIQHPRPRALAEGDRIDQHSGRTACSVQIASTRSEDDLTRPQLWCFVAGGTARSASNASMSENEKMFRRHGAAGAQGRKCCVRPSGGRLVTGE